IARALDLNYPIYSRARFMRTGKDRVEVAEMNTPVSMGEVQVRPGDYMVGDADGVLVVPASAAEKVLETARSIEEAEQAIEAECAKGTRLDEARTKFRYHQLQSK